MDLYTPADVYSEMDQRREGVLVFRPSAEHPIAPRASWPWVALPQGDGSVWYVDKERERAILARRKEEQRVYPVYEPYVTPWGQVLTRVTWWRPTPGGWVHVL